MLSYITCILFNESCGSLFLSSGVCMGGGEQVPLPFTLPAYIAYFSLTVLIINYDFALLSCVEKIPYPERAGGITKNCPNYILKGVST